MWDIPALEVKPVVAPAHTKPVGSPYNLGMTSKPRRPAEKQRTPLARRIQALRLNRNLTQVELAVEAGVSRGHIAKIETGGDTAGLDTLQALATYFGVSMDYLQTGTHPAPSPEAGRFVNDPEQLAILDMWEAIPKAERPRVARMIRAAALDPAQAV